jgi:hypothetical protein
LKHGLKFNLPPAVEKSQRQGSKVETDGVAGMCAVMTGAHTEFSAKSMVEPGDVAKAAVQSDIENSFTACGKPHGSVSKARSSQILMGRYTREALEYP